jgi:integrase
LHPGEAIALQWSDINFTDRTILVERNLYDGILGHTKTGTRRVVDMSQQLTESLSSLYVHREREKLSGKRANIPEWVFCQPNGQQIRIEHVRSIFDRALKRAGLSGHTPYNLRHTFASTVLAKGVPLTYVAKQLGHKRPTITLAYYAHWLDSGDKSFVDSLDSPSETPALAPLPGTTSQKPKYPQGNLAESNLNIC